MKKESPSRQTYTTIEDAYRYFNRVLFGSELPDCLIVLQRQPKMMGYVSHKRWINSDRDLTDELAINPEYFLGFPLMEIMQTLVHEQCHIWQNHFGTPGRRGYHNKQWADKMQEIGLMPSHTGEPGGKKVGEHMNDYAILGGRFQEAYAKLIESGFTLPWLDRMPVRKPIRTFTVFNSEGTAAEKILPINEMEPYRIVAGGEALVSDMTDSYDLNNDSNVVQIQPFIKKNTRVKYRCESCGNQLWGKPTMNIICGDCKINFIELHFTENNGGSHGHQQQNRVD
jgi:predicted SprT family Zn-dependent metalloprotease